MDLRRVLRSMENSQSAQEVVLVGPAYHWYLPNEPLQQKQTKVENRRLQLLDSLYSENEPIGDENTLCEWMALQQERDQLLKLSLQEENKIAKRKFVHDLHHMLKDLPEFSHSQCDQDVQMSLVTLQRQLQSYCNNIELGLQLRSEAVDATHSLPSDILGQCHHDGHNISMSLPRTMDHPFQRDIGIQYSPVAATLQAKSLPPPTPPPLPPVVPPTEQSSSSMTRTSDSNGQSKQASLLSDINNSRIKGSLRSTNVPRTPGGTPIRPKHWTSAAGDGSHVDLLQRALKKRFHNMRGHSTPKKRGISEYGSIEISSAWSEVGSNADQYASDPELTHTSTNMTGNYSPSSAANFEDSVFSSLREERALHYSTSL